MVFSQAQVGKVAGETGFAHTSITFSPVAAADFIRTQARENRVFRSACTLEGPNIYTSGRLGRRGHILAIRKKPTLPSIISILDGVANTHLAFSRGGYRSGLANW